MNVLKNAAAVLTVSALFSNPLTAKTSTQKPFVEKANMPYAFSLGAKVGTLGFGAEAIFRINNYFSFIASANTFRVGASLNRPIEDYDGKMRLLTAGGSIGIHPLQNGFKILAGLFYNGNELDVSSTLKQNITIGGIIFTPSQVRQANLTIGFSHVSPYLGLGFDAPFCPSSSWSFTGELGVLFQGSPKATLSKTQASGNPGVVDDFLKSEANNAASKPLLKYYPVMTLGVKFVV